MTLATEIKTNIGVFTNPKHELYVAECEPTASDLNPGPGEVTVHIRASGICGSDIHFQKEGCIGPTMVVREEHILGHESSGVVIQIHPSVKDLKVGDRVAVEPGVPCQNCDQCLTGHYNGCSIVQFKSTPPVPGFLRRYVKHPAKYCHKIGDLSFEQGALLEPISVAVAGIEQSGVRLSDPVLICGAGPIGLISAILARAAGAAPLVITDIDIGRLEYAKKVVPHIRTVHVERGMAPEQVAQKVIAVAGLKPRVCIECTGVESSIAVGIYSLDFAGTIHVVGVGKDFQNIPFMHLSVNEITMKFQYRYANTWPKGIRLLNDKIINVDHLVSHRFDLEDSEKAFETAADIKSGAIKVMILDE
jgi:L-iditol 2-dehydrogenase